MVKKRKKSDKTALQPGDTVTFPDGETYTLTLDEVEFIESEEVSRHRNRADDNGVLLDQIETLARVANDVDYEFSGGRRNDVVNLLYVIERLAKDRK